MTCNHCSKEYDSSVQACPDCGQALTYGAESAVTALPFAPPLPYDLSTTVSVSGSASIRSRLRPRTVWELIGEAFSLYWQNWKVFLPVSLILYAPVFIAAFFYQQAVYRLPSHPGNPGQAFSVFGAMGPYLLTLTVMSMIISFVLTRGVSNCYLNKPVSVRDVLKLNHRFWGYLGATFLVGLIAVAIGTAIMIPLVVMITMHTASQPGHAYPDFGMLLLMFPVMLLVMVAMFGVMIWFMVVGPAAVVEGLGATASLTRGVNLLRGFYWKGAGVMFLAGLISMAISISITMVSSAFTVPYIVSHPGAPMADMPIWVATAQSLIQWIGSSVAVPLSMLIMVLFYYDLRIRKEAFDLQMLAEQLGYGVEESAIV